MINLKLNIPEGSSRCSSANIWAYRKITSQTLHVFKSRRFLGKLLTSSFFPGKKNPRAKARKFSQSKKFLRDKNQTFFHQLLEKSLGLEKKNNMVRVMKKIIRKGWKKSRADSRKVAAVGLTV